MSQDQQQEAARAACAAAEKCARTARNRIHLFSHDDGGVAIALERALHLEGVARRAAHTLAHGENRPLYARIATTARAPLRALKQEAAAPVDPHLPLPTSLAALGAAYRATPSPLGRAELPAPTPAGASVTALEDARLDAYIDAIRSDVQAALRAQQARLAAAEAAASPC